MVEMAVTEESIKNAAVDVAKIVDKIDMKSIFSVFTSLLRAYGNFAKAIGTIEKTDTSSYEALLYLGQNAPQVMSILAQKSPPEEFGAFMKLTLKLIDISPKLDKIATLPSDEKIQLGAELENIANEFDELWKLIQEKSAKEKTEKC
jgi:hypothetical protein